MILKVFADKVSLGEAAADQAAAAIREAVRARGRARIVAASAASQFEFLAALTLARDVPWREVELFHLDEYIGLPMTHPASFCRFLKERLISKTGITTYHLLNGTEDPAKVIHEVGRALTAAPVDVVFLGIGENGHIAFNDPPADFETEEPFLVVNLDEACRRQQVGEGWYKELSEVPKQAISMSVRQILKSREILTVVPDARKAQAVQASFDGEVGPMVPASILRTHPRATVYLDRQSAARLNPATVQKHAAAS
ncbi:MAG TPA: glucosamine-6-phosphate deaminase [Candidatus Cybelea sp.]|nr:glucosamine-6-phosphate deaminase [Candidatus Cybelea sp.]